MFDRHRRFIFSLLIFATGCSSLYIPNASTEISKEAGIPQFVQDSVCDVLRKMPDDTEISCAVVRNGDISFFGFRRTNAVITNVNNRDALFEIGSLTKLFTSTVLASLITAKSVSPDDTIEYSLRGLTPEMSPACGKITLLELSNHTSGLPRVPNKILRTYNNDNPYRMFGDSDMRDYLADEIDTLFTPGKAYSYSNTGAGLLGYILAHRSGLSFEELLGKYVFHPYGMTHSGINHPGSGVVLVKGLDRTGESVSPWFFDSLQGAGAMYSSASDMALYIRAQFRSDPVLELQRRPTFKANGKISLAMGWHILHINDKQYYGHTGATGGYTSTIIIDLDTSTGVVLLSNVSGFNPKFVQISNAGRQILYSLNSEAR